MRLLPVLVIATVVACGGGTPTPTRTAAAPTARPTTAATAAAGGGAEQLCFLTPADWQQFNYVTGAEPEVTSDESVDALCTYANGLFLEVYTEVSEADAEETYETILENVPFDGQDVTLPGADQAQFDPSTGDDNAGIVVRAGRLVFTISGLARDSAQAELTTLAGLVLQRSGSNQ
jgi:hypothetical protein